MILYTVTTGIALSSDHVNSGDRLLDSPGSLGQALQTISKDERA